MGPAPIVEKGSPEVILNRLAASVSNGGTPGIIPARGKGIKGFDKGVSSGAPNLLKCYFSSLDFCCSLTMLKKNIWDIRFWYHCSCCCIRAWSGSEGFGCYLPSENECSKLLRDS